MQKKHVSAVVISETYLETLKKEEKDGKITER
jgi:hypothetical protein